MMGTEDKHHVDVLWDSIAKLSKNVL
jgi:hypothetical protein